ncbi:MAG: GNAT family N-acetyltransferase, partial [Acidimicrobiales bacterium]
ARLRRLLDAAAAGRPPAPDGRVEVISRPPGPVHAVVSFTAHVVVAATVEEDWVLGQVDLDDPGAPTIPHFVAALADHVGARAGQLDAVLVARPAAAGAAGNESLSLAELDPEKVAASDHPRLRRACQYRRDLRAFETEDGAGLVVVGRGLAGRLEVAFEVAPGARGRGLGRALARAGYGLAPAGEPVYAQVSPGNVASLRALLAAGYVPVASEVLLLDPERPRGLATGWPGRPRPASG